jgi:glycosyltransferase involved in cell wall biosynthesis
MENARLLRRLGYDVILMGKLPQEDFTEGYNHSSTYEEIPCYDILKPFPQKTYSPYTRSIASIEDVVSHIGTKRLKAIIAYNYPALGLKRITDFARKHDIVAIADCTEWYGWEGWRLDRNIRRWIDTELRMRVMAKRTGNVICASSYLQKHFSDVNTVVWPFCVDSRTEPWKREEEPKIHVPRRFVYSGNPGIGMAKDRLDRIIEAFFRLKYDGKKFEYTILGITKDEYLKAVPKHKELLNRMNDEIIFKGRVPHKEALRILRQSDYSIFLRPYNRVSHAGFPTKIMEAFTLGIPTITNATSDIELYVKNEENGFIIKGNHVDAIVETLNRAMNVSDDELLNMKRRCLEDNPFDIEKFIARIDRFLKRAV